MLMGSNKKTFKRSHRCISAKEQRRLAAKTAQRYVSFTKKHGSVVKT